MTKAIDDAIAYLTRKGVDIPADLYAEIAAVKAAPEPTSKEALERRIIRAIMSVDNAYYRVLQQQGLNVPFDYWSTYQADIRKQIATPLRQYIERSFTSYSDYVNFIDRNGAVDDIETAMTRAIDQAAATITGNTRRKLQELMAQGMSEEEILESIAFRFSTGHAEQVAITETTRAEGLFSEALSARLNEQGIETQIRWVTAEDERVCPICAPLDGKLKKDGGWITPKGELITQPPSHPRCRCQSIVEIKK